jgi:predicted metal-dependent hydrolase
LLLALVTDLFFWVRIEAAGQALGYEVRQVRAGSEIEPLAEAAGQPAPRRYRTETLDGPGAGFVARLVEWQPALVLVELASQQLPWPDWVAAAKAASATRRIPVVGFGPHVDSALRGRALDAGCDAVVPNGQMAAGLPALIERYARPTPNPERLAADCQAPLSALALDGLALFNAGEYFEAHEALEHAWNAEPGPTRELYRGILQVAVAFLQIERRNYRGAVKMMMRLRQWLDPLPDECQGVDVAQLRADAQAAREHLEALGEGQIALFDRRLLRPVVYRQSGQG